MERGSPVSGLTTSQLVAVLVKLGITPAGLDSVWEKEVTGAMLCEFCEEDIKDVFTEFKDRFRIRKLLRDITEKNLLRSQPAAASLHHENSRSREDEAACLQDSPLSSVSPKVEVASSALLSLSSPDPKLHRNINQNQSTSPNASGMAENKVPIIKEEAEDLCVVKRQRVDVGPEIPAAHSNAYNILQSSSLRGLGRLAVDNFVSPSPASLFLSMPDFLPPLFSAHSGNGMLSSSTPAREQRKAASPGNGCAEQALCLKKSPQRTASSPHARNDASSPATQPSSTTPDYLGGIDTPHLDFSSIMSMGHLAAKYSAQEILSKKGQRSRPNNAQKLGSILIRNAAQQANLWSAPPHLRSISQPQKQEFLNCVYQVAPHIREYEHLLWQRLSETLQNRRKYLLDKRLGKRGFSSSGQSSASHDFPDLSDWQVSSVQGQLNNTEEGLPDNEYILNEAISSPDCEQTKSIKIEPDT